MGEERTFATYVVAVTESSFTEDGFQAVLDEYGLESKKEFQELARKSIESRLDKVFEEDKLQLLEIRVDESPTPTGDNGEWTEEDIATLMAE